MNLHEKPVFEATVATVIVANSVTSVYAMLGDAPVWMEHFETGCLVFFVAELALRVKHHGWNFFRSAWSWLDIVIIALALLPVIGESISVLRAGRLARLIHLVRHLAGLRILHLAAMAHWRASGMRAELVLEGAGH